MPPTPMAASRLIAPVGMHSTRTVGASGPIFMMAPLPYDFSICAIARFNAFFFSSCAAETPIVASRGLPVRGDGSWAPPVGEIYPREGGLSPPSVARKDEVSSYRTNYEETSKL